MAQETIELSSHMPITCSNLCAFSGGVFGPFSNFQLSVHVRDVNDKVRVSNFTKAFMASLGAISNPFPGISSEQLQKASRLGKVLDRMDKSSYAAERSNAFKIIQHNLADLQWDLEGLRTVHVAMTPGADSDAKTEVVVKRCDRGWRKSRAWFDDLVETISKPLGLYIGCSSFGTKCQDGACVVGTLVQAIAACTVIAKIADKALRSNHYQSKSMEDDFCAGFCNEMLADFRTNFYDPEARTAAELMREKAKQWAWSDFGFVSWDSPDAKASDRDSVAAQSGRSSAQKRKRELDDSFGVIDRCRLRALGY
mmetsp:Transcript_46784/g.100002  ORF Transcript_46784/g.100002 Transcript_46784/m.100002 type:complete len:310 (+) Transcript_46784:92-1021(+)